MIKCKSKIILAICLLVLIIIAIVKNVTIYDINKSPMTYSFDTVNDERQYTKFVSKYIKPTKLRNFLDNSKIPFSLLEYCDSADKTISFFKYEAYVELFRQMFDKNRENFDDCSVTENFKKKFDKNLFNYFNLKETNDSIVSCSVDKEKNELIVEEEGDFYLGEPQYVYSHSFSYTLDSDGNVDDVIFDYTEE